MTQHYSVSHYRSLAQTIGANVNNEKLDDADFRQF
ncbi:unnamed protein product, partial [marine sediment metagenome]